MKSLSKLLILIIVLIMLCGCKGNYEPIESIVDKQDGYVITTIYDNYTHRVVQTITIFDDGKRVICTYQYNGGKAEILTEIIE